MDAEAIASDTAAPARQARALRHIWLCADDYGISGGVNTAFGSGPRTRRC